MPTPTRPATIIPIHVDPEFAASTPFAGTIAHGMLVLALIGEMMFAASGERWLTSGKLKVRFKAPTRPGDTVTASAQLLKQAERRRRVRGAVRNGGAARW